MSALGHAFQADPAALPADTTFAEQLRRAEGGDWVRASAGVRFLMGGDYVRALAEADKAAENYPPWFLDYLRGLTDKTKDLRRQSSAHFELWIPDDQAFLGPMALAALESAHRTFAARFKFRPKGKIRVEIYALTEDFSAASTLSMETLERSGAIGICKFHRLMILSPQVLPIGYRWLDALTHEYAHLMINELSAARMELWLHEGLARFLETSPRLDPPIFLTPQQKTDLKKAAESGSLIPFARMSPSMVYLKDQTEVSLAFSQVAYAVSQLNALRGDAGLADFLASLREKPFPDSFRMVFNQSPEEFESSLTEKIKTEPWMETKGALDDRVRFGPLREDESVGAAARMQMRFGDRMREKGLLEPALLQYEKALEQEPDNALILLKAARVCSALNNGEAAINHLKKAIEKNPNYVTPYVELSKWSDDKAKAALLKEAAALNPFEPTVRAFVFPSKP